MTNPVATIEDRVLNVYLLEKALWSIKKSNKLFFIQVIDKKFLLDEKSIK